jgi:hypothetical protein
VGQGEVKKWRINLARGFTVKGELGTEVNSSRMLVMPNSDLYDYSQDVNQLIADMSEKQKMEKEEEEEEEEVMEKKPGCFWVCFHGDDKVDSPGHRHEEAMLWMTTLTSIAFSKWWTFKSKLEQLKTSSGSSKTSSSIAAKVVNKLMQRLTHYHLWQSFRVSLFELLYPYHDDGDNDGVGAAGQPTTTTTTTMKQLSGQAVCSAWRYAEACLARINQESSTKWELPIAVEIKKV